MLGRTPAPYTTSLESAVERLGGLDILMFTMSRPRQPRRGLAWLGSCVPHLDILGAVNGVDTPDEAPAEVDRRGYRLHFLEHPRSDVMKALPAPGAYAYGASKAALIAPTERMISKDLAPRWGYESTSSRRGRSFSRGGPWDRVQGPGAAEMLDTAAKEACVIGRLGEPCHRILLTQWSSSPVPCVGASPSEQNLHVDGGFMQHVAF